MGVHVCVCVCVCQATITTTTTLVVSVHAFNTQYNAQEAPSCLIMFAENNMLISAN